MHAKANQLMPAVDDVTEAYKLDRSNTQCKAVRAHLPMTHNTQYKTLLPPPGKREKHTWPHTLILTLLCYTRTCIASSVLDSTQ